MSAKCKIRIPKSETNVRKFKRTKRPKRTLCSRGLAIWDFRESDLFRHSRFRFSECSFFGFAGDCANELLRVFDIRDCSRQLLYKRAANLRKLERALFKIVGL